MTSTRFRRVAQLATLVGALALAACGNSGSSSSGPGPKPYMGQWQYTGMGTSLLNLRADGTWSVIYYPGEVGGAVGSAVRGTYTFTASVPSDDTEGTLTRLATGQYDLVADTWQALMAVPEDKDLTVNAGSPRTLTMGGTWTYYGPEADIPDNL